MMAGPERWRVSERETFANAIIVRMDMTPTAWRRDFYVEWMRWENTGARWNPLATTRDGGEWPTNPYWNENGGNPVRNYASFEVGVAKTVETLNLQYYNAVRAAIEREHVSSEVSNEIRMWGTVGFAAMLDSGWRPAASPAPAPPPVVVPPAPTLEQTLVELEGRVRELEKLMGYMAAGFASWTGE